MPALLRCLSLLLLLLIAPVQAAGLPSLLGSSTPAQPQATEPLGKSLDEVIKNLENDQQRAKLLADLKKLRDATQQSQPTVEQGVLGLIGGALHDFERQFSGDASPFHRWSMEIDQAQTELTELMQQSAKDAVSYARDEHQVELIADEGIYAKVDEDAWAQAVAALTSELRADRPVDGLLPVATVGAFLWGMHP